MKPVVLLAGQPAWGDTEIQRIRSLGFDVMTMPDESGPVPQTHATVTAIVCNSLFLHHPVSLFPALKLVQLTSTGTDRVPIAEFSRRGIPVCSAGDTYAIPVAEWVLAKILEHYKHSSWFLENQRSRRWAKRRDLSELAGSTACVVGMGAIGQAVARRIRSFDVRVVGVDRLTDAQHADLMFDREDLDLALPLGDIAILAVPLTPRTHHLLDDRRLSLIRDGALVVNASRGAVVDETSLIQELASGRLGGAALDVFNSEPLPPSSPLWSLEEVSITPHIAHVSPRSKERLIAIILDNLAPIANSL